MIAERSEHAHVNEDGLDASKDWAVVPKSDSVNWALATGTQGDAESRVIQAYLGSVDRASVSRQQPPLFARIHCVALAGYLRQIDCRVEGTVSIMERPHRQTLGSLNLIMVETSPGKREPAPQEGLIFIRRPSGERLVLRLEEDTFGPMSGSTFTVIDANGWGGEFLDGWEEYAGRNAYLRGQAFYATGELVEIDPCSRPADVLMDPQAGQLVDRLILSFPEQARRFRRRGLSAKRGVILEGPPGTGKTMLCRALCNHLECTFIWLTSRHLCEDPGKIAQAWKLARLLSPTTILLEDLDLVAESRDSSFHGYLLGELMNQMDGVEQNDGILTIATTNHLDAIEKAVRNRPGRFDHAIHMGCLDEASRRKLLSRYLSNEDLEEGVLEHVICQTASYSGALLIDLVKCLIETAVCHSSAGEGPLHISMDLVDKALSEPKSARVRRPVGFTSEQQIVCASSIPF